MLVPKNALYWKLGELEAQYLCEGVKPYISVRRKEDHRRWILYHFIKFGWNFKIMDFWIVLHLHINS